MRELLFSFKVVIGLPNISGGFSEIEALEITRVDPNH